MMRPLLILLLCCLVWGEDANPWRTDLDAAIDAARAPGAPRPLAVLVSSPSCTWCHRMIDESADSPAVLRAAGEVVTVVLDAAQRPDLAALLGITSYPTLLLINRSGQEVRRVTGYLPSADLATTLRVLALNGDSQQGSASALSKRIDPAAMARNAEGRQQLAAMLGRGPAAIRSQVRLTLATTPEARPLLWPLLTDVTLAVRCDASAALAGESGDTHGYDPFADPDVRAKQATTWKALAEGPP